MTVAFHGKHVLITGASAGIGYALAQELAQRGAVLSLVARNAAPLERARKELCDTVPGAQVHVYPCDVRNANALQDTITAAAATMDGLDGVVANAGYCYAGHFGKLPVEEIVGQVETNLLGALLTLRLALPYLQRQRSGFVGIVGSPAGSLSIYGFNVYAATKAGLTMTAHILRQELERYGLTVHLLLPPDTLTPGYSHEITLYPPETRAVLAASPQYPPEEVARIFIRGIALGKRVVTVGAANRFAMALVRYAPWIWEYYVRRCLRRVTEETG